MNPQVFVINSTIDKQFHCQPREIKPDMIFDVQPGTNRFKFLQKANNYWGQEPYIFRNLNITFKFIN